MGGGLGGLGLAHHPVSAGGKGSGIFDESMPVQTRQRLNPPGGKTSDIFGSPVTAASPLAHPNKAKDHVLLHEGEEPTPDLKASASASPRLPRQEPASKVAPKGGSLHPGACAPGGQP